MKVRILPFLTTLAQLSARLEKFWGGWLLVFGIKESLVECATVCIKSVVILSSNTKGKSNACSLSCDIIFRVVIKDHLIFSIIYLHFSLFLQVSTVHYLKWNEQWCTKSHAQKMDYKILKLCIFLTYLPEISVYPRKELGSKTNDV